MTPDEAKRLLAACAAYDNRKPSLIAAQAWATALEDVPLDDDTFTAVARFYGDIGPGMEEGSRWIQPHHVRRIRAQIRRERLENFTYEPADPNESGEEYLRNLRAQQEAVASGRKPARLLAVPGQRRVVEGRVVRAVDSGGQGEAS